MKRTFDVYEETGGKCSVTLYEDNRAVATVYCPNMERALHAGAAWVHGEER